MIAHKFNSASTVTGRAAQHAGGSDLQSQRASGHENFLRLLPGIRNHARLRFRHWRAAERDEAIQEVIVSAFLAFTRLVARGKADRAFATPLAAFAVAQFHSGHRVGTPMNVRDVMSYYCQRQKGAVVQWLECWDDQDGRWQELVVEDRRTSPAEIAAFRIDFASWLASLSRRDRKIAVLLSTSESTGCVARRFRLSPGRISQLRRELHHKWQVFVGDVAAPAPAVAST